MNADMHQLIIDYIINNQDRFYKLAYSYVHNKEAALDIIQNAIVRALTYYPSIRNEKYIRSWFYRVLVNECYTFIKKNSREFLYEPEDLQNHMDKLIEEQAPDLDMYEQIDKLSKDMKTVIILRFYEELSLAEIAGVTNVTLSTVKYRLYTALKILRKNIQEE